MLVRNTAPPPPPPSHSPAPLPWRLGMTSEEKLITKIWNYAKIPESSLYFPSQDKLIQTCAQRYNVLPPLPLSCFQIFPPPHLESYISLTYSCSWTSLGHHALLIWQDWLNCTVFFSIKAVYLETETTPPPEYKFLPWLWSIANIVQQHYLAKFGAFSPKCTIFFTIWLNCLVKLLL